MSNFTENLIARSIDQTNLRPNATEREISSFIEEAKQYNFCTVAIMPAWIPLATSILKGSQTTVVAAIDFPLGTGTTYSKLSETIWAIDHGPEDIELDMVMNIPLLKSRKYDILEKEISAVVDAAKPHIVKIIIEVPVLTQDEIVIASLIVENAGADFVKTSTGFKQFRGWRPSTVADVNLIKRAISNRLKIKVAGGISTLSQSIALIEAGASRIGTSSGVAIIKTYRQFRGT